MSRIWFTSDYQMGHRNIIGLCERPFSDVEEIRERMDAVTEEFSEN